MLCARAVSVPLYARIPHYTPLCREERSEGGVYYAVLASVLRQGVALCLCGARRVGGYLRCVPSRGQQLHTPVAFVYEHSLPHERPTSLWGVLHAGWCQLALAGATCDAATAWSVLGNPVAGAGLGSRSLWC